MDYKEYLKEGYGPGKMIQENVISFLAGNFSNGTFSREETSYSGHPKIVYKIIDEIGAWSTFYQRDDEKKYRIFKVEDDLHIYKGKKSTAILKGASGLDKKKAAAYIKKNYKLIEKGLDTYITPASKSRVSSAKEWGDLDRILFFKENKQLDEASRNSIENKVLLMLSGAKFERWFESDFMDYIGAEEDAKSEEQILKDIKQMLK